MNRWPRVSSPALIPSTEKRNDFGLFGLRPERRHDGMQRPHPVERIADAPQRIDFGQGKFLTTSGTISPITSIAGRPGFSITASRNRPFLSGCILASLIDLSPAARTKPCDGAFRRTDARALLLLPHVGLPHRHALDCEREPPWRDERLGALVRPSPPAISRSVTSLRKSSAARACMRAGISSENNSSSRSGIAILITLAGSRRSRHC